MELTKQEFRDECLFAVTMQHARDILKRGLISKAEYHQMLDKMKRKYHPVSDGLFFETDLQITENRGLIRSNKSTAEVEHEAVGSRIPARMLLHSDHDPCQENVDGEDDLHS